ncbi:MAG: hypothetical protein JNL11_00910 [Bdellovibrionaceae bacterium]|nr:hypothetical protein [Pseudobdellovibrionaceae bacterium]
MMIRVLLALLVVTLYAFSNTATYVDEGLNRPPAPLVSVTTPFQHQNIDITLINQEPIAGLDEYNKPVQLPVNTQFMIQATLDQIYEGFKRPLETQSLYSRDKLGEYMKIQSPEGLQIKSILVDLIQMKQQEQLMERLGYDDAFEQKKELIEVRVKKEGEFKKVKVDLKKAVEQGKVKVQEDEVFTARSTTDYNGKETWSVTPQTEAQDIIGTRCTVCSSSQKDDLAKRLSIQTTNALIKAKAAAYSADKRTKNMIASALKNRKSPQRYLETKPQCYKYVKDAMLDGKWLDERISGVSPRYAGEKLKEKGFINLMDDPQLKGKINEPSQAPWGAILVYEPVPADRMIKDGDEKQNRYIIVPDYGHIEFKTEDVGENGYVSDYYSKKARTGNSLRSVDRKLIGIYIKNPKSA